MLPPCFWALAGLAIKARLNTATWNMGASARERIAAFIEDSLR